MAPKSLPLPGWIPCREETTLQEMHFPLYEGEVHTYALPLTELQMVNADCKGYFSLPTGARDVAIDWFQSETQGQSLRQGILWRLLATPQYDPHHTVTSPLRVCLPWLHNMECGGDPEQYIALWHRWSLTAGGGEDWAPLFESVLTDRIWIPARTYPGGWVRFTWPEETYQGNLGAWIRGLERGGLRIREFHLLRICPWEAKDCWVGACRMEGEEQDIQATFRQGLYLGLPLSLDSPLDRLFLTHRELPLMGWASLRGQLHLLADLFSLVMPTHGIRQRLEEILCAQSGLVWTSLGLSPPATLQVSAPISNEDSLATTFLDIWTWAFPNAYVQTVLEALVWRLDPHIVHRGPWAVAFSHLPFSIFYVYSVDCYGFHIRFMEIARGGFRTLFPRTNEEIEAHVGKACKECYDLAWTQQLKNKEIPEGGSKALLIVTSGHELTQNREHAPSSTHGALWLEIQRKERMERAQKRWVSSLLRTLMSTENKKIEHIYLGPDEGMSTDMIEWIAAESMRQGYPVGKQLMSGKSIGGIHHKQYGVTSLGVHAYLLEVLNQLGWDMKPFTVKMTGGPNGDVAGNEMRNLLEQMPCRASIILIKDGSGLLYDPVGVDRLALLQLVQESLPVSSYPIDLLHENGWLLTLGDSPVKTQNMVGSIRSIPVGSAEAQMLYDTYVHSTYADVFLPCGGRPGTLSKQNMHECWSEERGLSSRIMIEGANLYPTAEAREFLEKKGMWIIKDSSANKGGVMSSSLEILGNMVLGPDLFEQERNVYISEVLQRIRESARQEAKWLLQARAETGMGLTHLSNRISHMILERRQAWLEHLPLLLEREHHHIFLEYCLPILRTTYRTKTLDRVAADYQKAAIATFLACSWVYRHGYYSQGTIQEMIQQQYHQWFSRGSVDPH